MNRVFPASRSLIAAARNGAAARSGSPRRPWFFAKWDQRLPRKYSTPASRTRPSSTRSTSILSVVKRENFSIAFSRSAADESRGNTITALSNAASIAALMLTTETMVTNIDKEDKARGRIESVVR